MYDINYLCGDTYFRSFMDVEGFMPLIYLFNYPNIGGVGADYNGVLEALKDHATLEVDAENETIRLRAGWDAVCTPFPAYCSCTSMVMCICASCSG